MAKLSGALIAFLLGLAVAGLLLYFVGFFTTGSYRTFWDGSHEGIEIGAGVVLGMGLLNFVVGNLDKFINKKL